jgi:hypothetical protein
MLPDTPEVTVLPDPTRPPHSVAISAESRWTQGSATQTMAPVEPSASLSPSRGRAFLIVGGERTMLLTEPVVSVGRRFDNDIVLDDPRVSRTHAQLRLRFGRYVIYDLGSTAGTFVNGERIDECVLRAGDVISIGGVPLIYGEEPGGEQPPPATGTRPLNGPPNISTSV